MDKKGGNPNRPVPAKPDAAPGKSVKQKRTPLRIAVRIFGILALAVLALVFIVGASAAGLVAGGVYGIIQTAPLISADDLRITNLNSYVYDAEGNVIAELKKEENRVWINFDEIPPMLIDAYVAVEDKRFFEHEGIDYTRIANAGLEFIQHLFNPDVDISGGSTITQQLIKNLTKNTQVTLTRKIGEQWQALNLEKNLTKNEILTYYLNVVPMGHTFYGIETAAKGYYGKDVRDLSLAECASLAGITNWPTKYMPINEKNIEANLTRTKSTLKLMLEQGKISQAEYDEAISEKIAFTYNPEAGKVIQTSNQSYFVDEAIKSVKQGLMKERGYSEDAAINIIYNNGLHIYTTMQPNVQSALEEVYTDPEYFTDKNPYTDDLPQSAMVIIDPETGYVRGIYGGRGAKEGSVFNRATQAQRSPGSSIKPLVVYGPGLDTRKITAATVVDDVKQYLNEKTPDKEWPRNVEVKNFGLTGVREGIVDSRNVVAALILKNYVGVNTGLDYLAKLGMDRKDEQYLSIAMGGFSKQMTPLEMGAAYTSLANKGVYTQPIFYTEVRDSNDKVILSSAPVRTQVFSEQTTFILDNILEEVVKSGTAASYGYGTIKYTEKYTDDGKEKERTVVIPSAGKTGTSDESKDKWFCGFTTHYVGVTWYGYDTPVSMSYKGSIENYSALKIWNAVMNKIHVGLEAEPINETVPPGIVKRTICIDSGKIATDLCKQDPRGSRVREEYFIEGTEPGYSDTCSVHIKATVCTASHDALGRALLANEYCPEETTKEIVAIKRPVEYKPKFPNDAYPADAIYELPEGEYCTVHGSHNVIIPPVSTQNPTPDPGQNGTPTPTPTPTPEGTIIPPVEEDIGEPIQN